MKDIKTFLIGFLTCTCMFLIMGQTKAKPMDDIKTMLTQNGRYQAFGGGTLNTEYMIDTRTGELFKFSLKNHWQNWCANEDNCFEKFDKKK